MKIEFSDVEVCEIVKLYVSQRFQSAKKMQITAFTNSPVSNGVICIVEKPIDAAKET